MKHKITLSIILIIIIMVKSYTQDFEEVKKIVATEREQYDAFGYSVDISGSYVIVGAPYEDDDVNDADSLEDAGSAYIFKRDNSGNWDNYQKITSQVRAEDDNFGYAVAMDGRYSIVGAYGADVDVTGTNMPNAGYAYIFSMDSLGTWSQEQRLYASDHDTTDLFGYAVGISGNYAIVGAYWEDEDELGSNTILNAGSAYIFEKSTTGDWIETQKLVAWDRNGSEAFGTSVDICGDIAIVGSPCEYEDELGGNSVNNAGSAYLFKRNTSGQWMPLKKCVSPDRSHYDFFGQEVSVYNDVAVIGTYDEDDDENDLNYMENAGSAYIFESDASGTWDFVQKIVPSDRDTFDLFGYSVDVSNSKIVVSAIQESEDNEGDNTVKEAGSVYLFEKNASGTWEEVKKILASDRDITDKFGVVAIDKNYLIAGVCEEDHDINGEDSLNAAGSAYIFELCPAGNASPAGNIINNGNFESCALSSWNLYKAANLGVIADYQFSDGACFIKPLKLNSSPEMWHIQLEQPFSSSQLEMLEEEERYTLKFNAYAEVNNMPIQIFFGQNEEPYTTLLSADIFLNKETEVQSFEFSMNSTFSSMKLAINLGTETTWAAFDNISLIKVPASGTCDVVKSRNIRVTLNPASGYIELNAESGTTVKLYNISGILLLETIMDDQIESLDISRLQKGMYIIQLSNNDFIHSEKILVH